MSKVTVERKTKETEISAGLVIDGSGQADIATTIPFFDHMLNQLAHHGFFDIDLKAIGDIEVDFHHTVEDCGIALGQAFSKSVGEKKQIKRFGHAVVPLNESISSVTVDFSGRPFLVFDGNGLSGKIGDFDAELIEEFLHSFANNAGLTLHVKVMYGSNLHHMAETVFKALAKALDEATRPEPRAAGVVSTKGTL
jgi:imidazoleglycerol-phosphate dehydratase